MPNDVKQLSLLCEIGSQYLASREHASAERLCRECIDEYTRIEQKGRFVRHFGDRRDCVRETKIDIVAPTTTPGKQTPIACDFVLLD